MTNPPIVYSELDPLLVQDVQGNLKSVYNEDAIRASIDNILGTSPSERVMLPQFASGIKSLLFEPLTEQKMAMFAQNISDTIEVWDNRVSVQNVAVTVDTDHNQVSITVSFSIPGFSQLLTQTTNISA
jgi:hypothetical protein